MARYLFMADYSQTGSKGLLAAGGIARREVIAQTAASVGGRLETFDFAFGKHDAFVIAELPNHAAATKIALSINASGSARVETVVLVDAEDVGANSDEVLYAVPGLPETTFSQKPFVASQSRLASAISDQPLSTGIE